MAFEEANYSEVVPIQYGEIFVAGGSFYQNDSIALRTVLSHADRHNSVGWPSHSSLNPYFGYRYEWHQESVKRIGTHTIGGVLYSDVVGEYGNSIGLSASPWLYGEQWFGFDESAALRDKLINKLIGNMHENRMNLGEAYHTRGDTCRLIGDAATKIAKSFIALKRGNLREAVTHLTGSASKLPVKRYAGGIPEQWLALQYGWKPLVQDCYSAMKIVQKAWSSGGAFTVDAKASMRVKDIDFTFAGGSYWPVMRQYYKDQRMRGKASITYRMESPQASALSETGITNPASIAWEILPYSFVVDWFLPIGPYLENLTYDQGLSFASGYISRRYWCTCHREIHSQRHVSTSDGYEITFTGGSGHGSFDQIYREILTDFPSVPVPHFKDPVSLGHMANGLSLLINAFK